MQNEQRIEIDTPMGKLVAYPCGGGEYPGIAVELKKPGIDYMLNLAVVECNPGDDEMPAKLVSHVWGDGLQEDATHDITHVNVEEYFNHTESSFPRELMDK